MARISIEVTAEQHRYIKMLAAAENTSIKDLLLERVMPEKPRVLRPEVAKGLEDSRNGIGLTTVGSIAEMYEKMGIKRPRKR